MFWALFLMFFFSDYLGIGCWRGGGGPKRLVHNVLLQFFTLGEVSEPFFFDTVTAQNDHPTYVKHVLGSIYVFSTLLGYSVQGRETSRGIGTQFAYSAFHPMQTCAESLPVCYMLQRPTDSRCQPHVANHTLDMD